MFADKNIFSASNDVKRKRSNSYLYFMGKSLFRGKGLTVELLVFLEILIFVSDSIIITPFSSLLFVSRNWKEIKDRRKNTGIPSLIWGRVTNILWWIVFLIQYK